jgi:hypothetical protein
MQPIAKDPLVAHERVLGTRLPVIARLLLPLASPDLANAPDDPISRSASTASRLRSLDRRHNDPRTSTDCSVIQRTAVVGTVADDSTDLAWHAIDEVDADADANVAVINTRINQSLTDDHAIAVDTDVQLLPATNALAAVFDSSPLAFAEDGETAAIDDQINPAKLLRHP